MSKEAILLIVDVGYSMDQPFSQKSSRAKVALQCCKLTLQQKLFNNSSHELGLIIFGDNDSDDGNSLLLKEIGKPNIDLVRQVEALSHGTFNNTKVGGDIFSTINYAQGVLQQHCKKKKISKRIFLFTNGMGESAFDKDELKSLAFKTTSSDIKLNIVPIDFMISYDTQENKLGDDQMLLEPVQQRNSQLLMYYKELCPNNMQILPASIAIELYKRFRKRDTNPVAKFKGSMQIAPGLCIDVATYKAIKRQKLKSLARYDTSVPFDPIIGKDKEVIIENNYVVQGDQTGTIVQKDNIVNAYNYGPQLVPIASVLQTSSKIFEEKNLRLLGFVDKAKIPRYSLMSEVDIVIPGQNVAGRKLFTSLIYSMISLNKYAIGRFVGRNNKNGVNPRMVVLIPYRSAQRQMFYLIELPTIQDVRVFPFNSLKQSTDRQKEIIEQLIDKMMLYREQDDEIQEEVKIQNTFNPTRQYFYQTLFYRALNSDANDVPDLDPVIKNYLTPQLKKYDKTQFLMKDFKKQFKLFKKINLQQKKKKKTLMWKDLLSQMSTAIKEQSQLCDMMDDLQITKPAFKFNAQDEEEDIKFNPSNPITSFKNMINYNKKDLVSEALVYMKNYIIQKLKFNPSPEALKELLQCAKETRNACISQQEEVFWDNMFNQWNNLYPKFFDQIKNEGLGLIKGKNSQIFKSSALHSMDIEIDDIWDLNWG